MKRAVSLILALALALTLLPGRALAASAAYGSDVWLKDTPLQDGVTLSDNTFWSGSYDKPRHEYYIAYTPGIGTNLPGVPAQTPSGDSGLPGDGSGGLDLSWLFPDRAPEQTGDPALPGGSSYPDSAADPGVSGDPGSAAGSLDPAVSQPYTGVRPVASYGASVCGRSTVSEAAAKYESLGYRVVGAINGDFYDTGTGFPLGAVISGGELLSDSGGYYAVGFRADGSAVLGKPDIAMTASVGGTSVKLASLNKPRVDGSGVTMLTYDFRDDHTTGASVETPGVNVLAAVVGGKAAVGGQLVLQVEEVAEDAQKRTLREDQVLLTQAADGYESGLSFLRSLAPGMTVVISFTSPDARWNEVTEAIGAYYLLVENGKAQEGFEASAAPRTAVGVKASGEVILYTIDGRQSSHSMGASLGVLASRMAELGCVTALCLDGGGSTTAAAASPADLSARLLNSPSDKTQRKVTNHLLLLAPGESTGIPGGVHLTAAAPAVLAGHTVKLTANVRDTAYFPMNLPLTLSATAGEVVEGLFTAPQTGGRVTVYAGYEGFTAQREILVLDNPGSMTVRAAGSGASTITARPGESLQLEVSGTYNHLPLEMSPQDVTWSVDPAIGTVDANGLFTAAMMTSSGTVTVTRGNVTAKLTISVEADHPFVDLEGNPYTGYISAMYRQGVFLGVTQGEELYAFPDKGVTRAEFSVLLARYLKLDLTQYAGVQTPFVDLEEVESWAGDAIRAMYALKIVNGVDPTHFGPQEALERSQAVTMLGRGLHLGEETPAPEPEPGEPAPGESGEPSAADPTVTDPSVTDPAVTGSPDPAPGGDPEEDEPVLPEEEGGYLLSVQQGDSQSNYGDAEEIPAYARDYFRVLVELGAVEGSEGLLRPAAPMTRAEICKALFVLLAQV